MECRAWRRDGEVFNAQVCFSTFVGPSGCELAVLFNDRNLWVPEGTDFVFDGASNLAFVSACVDLHEVRNLSFAVEASCRDLLSRPVAEQHERLERLLDLARGLRKLTGRELRPQGTEAMARRDFSEFAGEVKALLVSLFDGSDITLEWNVPAALPQVWMDPESLFLVFTNLAKNSLGELDHRPAPKIVCVCAAEEQGRVFIHFCDNGAGAQDPEELFRPVIRGADVMKVGLYISRAILRSGGGDLRYEREAGRTHFVLELPTANRADPRATVAAATG